MGEILLAIGYAAGVLILITTMLGYIRGAQHMWQVYASLAITVGYGIGASIAWLTILSWLDMREPMFVAGLVVVIIAVIAVGMVTPASSERTIESHRSRFWSYAAGVRRTYHNWIGVPH